jgi:hypothetical protein
LRHARRKAAEPLERLLARGGRAAGLEQQKTDSQDTNGTLGSHQILLKVVYYVDRQLQKLRLKNM